MKANSSRCFTYLSSCCSKDPVIKDAIIKAPKDAGKSHAQEASLAPDLQSTNKSSRRHFPSRLPSCCSKDPVIKDAIIKVSKDAGKNHSQESSSSRDLQPTNKNSHRHSSLRLQKMYADKKKSFVSIPFFNSRKKSINQGFPAASTSSAISQGTQEIQEEPELHLLSEEASANQDLPQNLEGQNSPARQVLHISDAPTTDDGALQPHPEHSVAAVLDRNSQKARTANRDRHAFLSMTKADFSWKKTTKALANVYAAAGSGLSHSAAALRNLSPYQISMASGVSWAATAACSGINHAIFSQKRDVVSLLSNAAHFGAGIASIVTTNFSYRSNPNQTNVNYAATSSNILWVAASTLEAVSALQNGRELPSEYGMSALAYTATGLGIAAGLANVASAAVSIRNTVRIRAALTP